MLPESADAELSEEELEAPRTQVQMPKVRPAACCDFQMAVKVGRCALKGCERLCFTGCKAHGQRLCWPGCVTKHVNGVGESKVLRAEIEWQCDVCDSE